MGTVTAEAAEETGLRIGTTVVAGGTDISSAALGVGVTRAGQAYYSMGTGSNLGIMIPTEQRVEEYRILKWPHVLARPDDVRRADGVHGGVAQVVPGPVRRPRGAAGRTNGSQRVRPRDRAGTDTFHPGRTASSTCHTSAIPCPRGGTRRRAACSSGSSRSRLAPTSSAALIEGVAFDLNSNVRIAEEAGVQFDELILNGGPTKSALWNQITADVTNKRLVLKDVHEAAPLGDAFLAAAGAGIYETSDRRRGHHGEDHRLRGTRPGAPRDVHRVLRTVERHLRQPP